MEPERKSIEKRSDDLKKKKNGSEINRKMRERIRKF